MNLNSPDQTRSVVSFCNVNFKPDGARHNTIKALSLDVKHGEVLALLGESGSGKTTTLRLVNRMLTPTSGEVLVDGKSTNEWDVISLRRRIGYVIQEGGLFPHFNIERNVVMVPSLAGKHGGWDKARLRERACEMLNLVGLDPINFAERFPHELSGGQRQRVGVARALAADPPLLLLDEPFGSLDPITRHQLQKEFLALTRRLSKTVIFVTHDVREALIVGSRIGFMRGGELAMLLTPDEFTRSDDKTVRTYMESLKIDSIHVDIKV